MRRLLGDTGERSRRGRPADQPMRARRDHRAGVGGLFAALAIGALLGLGLDDARGEAGEKAPELPGPAPRSRRPGAPDVRKANEECASCHVEIAEEWRVSLHRQAWIDPVFQKAYAIEPVAFCRSCHAPEASPAAAPGEAAQAVGVGCTTCHVQGEMIVGATASSGRAPHGVFADARMATRQACAACHQFDFPGERLPMQDTLREHAASSFASTECQSCHMPLVASVASSAGKPGARPHKSHAFQVIGDPSMIRRAVKLSASRPSARKVAIAIAAGDVGHAFPTGDMFRRLEVRAEAISASGEVIARADPVILGRTFTDRSRDREKSPAFAFHRVEAEDSRVPPPGAGPAPIVELSFGGPVGPLRVRWRVAYQRMGTAMAASFGVEQAIDEVIVGEGELPPYGSRPSRP